MALAALGTGCRPEAPVVEPEARGATPLPPSTWQPIDGDGDGVADTSDACPRVPEDPDKIDDADGCPETDADKDLVIDEDDYCPKEPGNETSRLGRGCPCLSVLPPTE